MESIIKQLIDQMIPKLLDIFLPTIKGIVYVIVYTIAILYVSGVLHLLFYYIFASILGYIILKVIYDAI